MGFGQVKILFILKNFFHTINLSFLRLLSDLDLFVVFCIMTTVVLELNKRFFYVKYTERAE